MVKSLLSQRLKTCFELKIYPIIDASHKYMRKPCDEVVSYSDIKSCIFTTSISADGFSMGYSGVENFNFVGDKTGYILGDGCCEPSMFNFYNDMNWIKFNVASDIFNIDTDLKFLFLIKSNCFLILE